MTIPNVAPNDPILAATTNALIDFVNSALNRVIFTASGSWQLPLGVTRFKVYLAGGGGAGRGTVYFNDGIEPGNPGGNAPLISAIFTGASAGTSYDFTIGGGGTVDGNPVGGTSTFGGSSMVSTGGQPGQTQGRGGPGSATFPSGQPAFYHTNELFGALYQDNTLKGYGSGGVLGNNGIPGVCVIEW